jgi:hypothetical protein
MTWGGDEPAIHGCRNNAITTNLDWAIAGSVILVFVSLVLWIGAGAVGARRCLERDMDWALKGAST